VVATWFHAGWISGPHAHVLKVTLRLKEWIVNNDSDVFMMVLSCEGGLKVHN
jgi:hypothetical protein